MLISYKFETVVQRDKKFHVLKAIQHKQVVVQELTVKTYRKGVWSIIVDFDIVNGRHPSKE